MPPDLAPEPWSSFLTALDRALEEPVTLHCIGGFALAMLYGLPRPTIDVDCLAVIPDDATARVEELGGKGSGLHLAFGVYLQHVGIVTAPENYAERLSPIMPLAFRRLSLFGLEAHDLALSKLERNSGRDREDVRYLFGARRLDLDVLEARYRVELRPYLANAERHDLTIRLWREMLSPV